MLFTILVLYWGDDDVILPVLWVRNPKQGERLPVQSIHINTRVEHGVERLCALHTERVKQGHWISVVEWKLPLLEICQYAQLPDSLPHWQLLLLGIMTCQILSISMVDAPGCVIYTQAWGHLTGTLFFMDEPCSHTYKPVRFILDNDLPVVLASSETLLSQYTVLGVIWFGAQNVADRLSSPVHMFPVLGYFHFWMGCVGVQRWRT